MVEKSLPFREGMVINALNDPEDVTSHENFEVLASTPEGILCEDRDGCYLPFYPEEYEKHRIFVVGHVRKRWLRRNEWVFGVYHRTIYVGHIPPLDLDPHQV